MKKIQFVMFAFMAILMSCTTETESVEAKTANATANDIEAKLKPNGLAYDGCDTHIQIKNGDDFEMLKASEKTKALVEKIISDEQARLPKGEMVYNVDIMISYNKTNQKAELLCGWGKKSIVDEIEVVKISKR
jgi:hypothetical protein